MSSQRRSSSGRSRADRYGIADEVERAPDNTNDLHADAYSSTRRVAGGPAASNDNYAAAVEADPILPTPVANLANKVSSLFRGVGNFTATAANSNNNGNEDDGDDDEGNEYEPLSPNRAQGRNNNSNDIFRDEPSGEDDDDEDDPMVYEMTLQELLYSTSAFYAICVPVTITMILSALAVVFVNDESTLEYGAAAMNAAYATFDTTNASGIKAVALGLLNGLIMVAAIGTLTFGIVLLYKYRCMWCLIGYMMFASTSLLGFLGGNLWMTAINIYQLPVDWLTFVLFLWNFASVGVLSIFYGKGVPKYFPQGYLICTSVILAWHLSYFDDVMAWTLLFMLAVYDLCAVLTPCGPLKALVNLMSEDDAPDMPGLLYEAELPPEARRPGGGSRNSNTNSTNTNTSASAPTPRSTESVSETEGPRITLPLAVARVYNLRIVDVPASSRRTMRDSGVRRGSRPTNQPLLEDTFVPEDPNAAQLQASVIVQLPVHGGRIEKVRRNGRAMYLERDRHGNAKRILWVDKQGRVFAESSDFGEDESEAKGNNSIRLGLGDFIFYSVLVAKAAEYSFTTFMACMLVILAGLGSTLVLLSVFHHALPALPISICLGIFFYVATRLFIEPWIESILIKPIYV